MMRSPQEFAQFRESHIRLFSNYAPQILLDLWVQLSRRPMAQLVRPLQLPGRELLPADLLAIPITDAKLPRQFLQAPSSRGISLQQLRTQVI
jgi:hypothetical protein